MRMRYVGGWLVGMAFASARAETLLPILPPVFGHGMVLQRGVDVPVWGTSEPGSAVTVVFAGQTVVAVADGAGAWRTRLKPLTANSESREFRVHCGGEVEPVVFTNVVVGDVWVCSGQSNMAGLLGNHAQARTDELPMLRQYTKESRTRGGKVVGGKWELATAEARSGFTATGYFFGRKVHRDVGVPVGILKEAVSGSLIEPWIPRDALLADPELAGIIKAQPTKPVEGAAAPEAYVQTTEAGRKFVGFIQPLIPYAIKGVVWYQGEANARDASGSKPYGRLLRVLVRSWREAWGMGDLPFYYVQLPSIADPKRTYYLVREQMLQALKAVPNVGMAVSIDVNEGLHPPSKHIIGERLALLALRGTYGKEIVACGPLFRAMECIDGKIVCQFTELGGGLVVKGEALADFEIAGDDRAFHPAVAIVVGDGVVVSSAAVPAPVAVRYAWRNAVDAATLFNREGLPASPFRSDAW